MRKIKKGDDVIVITGKDKGKRGMVTRVVDLEHVLVGRQPGQETPAAESDEKHPRRHR